MRSVVRHTHTHTQMKEFLLSPSLLVVEMLIKLSVDNTHCWLARLALCQERRETCDHRNGGVASGSLQARDLLSCVMRWFAGNESNSFLLIGETVGFKWTQGMDGMECLARN